MPQPLRCLTRPALLGALVLQAASCHEGGLTEPARDAALQAQFGASAGRVSTVHATLLADPSVVVGRSTLIRTAGGVRARFSTSQLTPGTATTFWMVVFNHPEFCSDGVCGSNDLFTPGVETDLLFTDGKFVGPSGRNTYSGQRLVGDASGSVMPIFGFPAPGILNAAKAEIHLVVRNHGPIVPEIAKDMISSFGGGCAGLNPELGTPGPNTCANVQAGVHPPLGIGRE